MVEIRLGKMLQPSPAAPSDALVPYLKAGHVQWNGHATENLPEMWASRHEVAQYRVRPGDVLVCEGGEVGRSAIADELSEPTIIQNSLHRLRSSRVENRYLHYTLQAVSSSGWLDVVTNKATIAHLTVEKLGALTIPLRSMAEQVEVSNFLDRETGRIDRLVEKKRRLVELLEEKRTALISHAVTKGLDPTVPMKDSGIPWLGEIPAHWDARPLKALVSKIGSGKTPRGGATVYVDSGVTFIRSQNVHFGGLRLDDVVFISADIDAEMAGTRVRHGDVLLNITGASLGRCCAVARTDLRANVNQHVSILRPLRSVPSSWLAYALESHPLQEQIWATQGGAAREGLNSTAIGQLRLPVGTQDEQTRIAAYLDEKTTLISAALKRIREQLEKLAEYRQALITEAVTGQLDITAEQQDPEEVVA